MENLMSNKASKPLLEALFNAQISHLEIPNFITENDRLEILQQISSAPMDYYNVKPIIGKIGIALFEFQNNPSLYFLEAEKATNLLRDHVPMHKNLIKKIRDYFSNSGFNVSIAQDPITKMDYFSGLIRDFSTNSSALIHGDFAPFDATHYHIRNNVAQVAINIHLQVAESGGFVEIFHKQWEKVDEKFKMDNSYGYADSVLGENCSQVTIKPNNSDLILFNSRLFHSVSPNRGSESRVTLSCFAGLRTNGEIVLWS